MFNEGAGPGDRLDVAYNSLTVMKGPAKGRIFATGTFTEIGALPTAQRKNSWFMPVKRSDNGHRHPPSYVKAYTLTLGDFAGRLLGINVGTPLKMKPGKWENLLFCIAVVFAFRGAGDKQGRLGAEGRHSAVVIAFYDTRLAWSL